VAAGGESLMKTWMRGAGMGGIVAGLLFLALLVMALVACSDTSGKKAAVVIGDPSILRPDDKELTPTTLLMNSAMYLDRPAKVRTELRRVGSVFGDCRMVSTSLGPQDLEVCVNEVRWSEKIRAVPAGAPIVVIGMMSAMGSDQAPRLILRVE
jgi:hypothetical protein